MKMYEIEVSDKELKLIKEATDLGLNILSFNVDRISETVFKKNNDIKNILHEIKLKVFKKDIEPKRVDSLMNKETRLRYHSLQRLKKQLENL